MSITDNYRSTNFADQDGPNGLVPGEQRRDSDDITDLEIIRRASSNNHSGDTCQIKSEFKEYFATKREQTSNGTGLTKSTDFFIVTKNTNLQ